MVLFYWVQMKDLSEDYFEKSKWSAQHCVPTLKKYLPISLVSSTYPILECASFVGMGEIATKEAFEWITSFPKIVQAAAIIGHIMNDIRYGHNIISCIFYHINIFHSKFCIDFFHSRNSIPSSII